MEGRKIGHRYFETKAGKNWSEQELTDSDYQLIQLLAASQDRSSLSYALHNNTPWQKDSMVVSRGCSAYYYLLADGRAVLEWGLIGEGGEAKLHQHLNCNSYFNQEAGLQRSGHLAPVALRSGEEFYLALWDSVARSRDDNQGKILTVEGEEAPLVEAFTQGGIYSISTDGFLVLPVGWRRALWKKRRANFC